MKKLLLARHGKSSWDLPLDDIDRPLIQRGVDDINRVAIHAVSILPDSFIIWSSPAKRASETAHVFAKNIAFPVEKIIFKKELYTFDVYQLEKMIKSCPNDTNNLILFGHNEAISNFVNKFGNKFIDHVPTAGLVAIQFETDNWAEIQKGKTIQILFPKNLK
jgi:phosphohistidine phosphatase